MVRAARWCGIGLALAALLVSGAPAHAQGGSATPGQLLYRPKTRHPLTLVEVYAEGLMFWNKKLTEHEANSLAITIIDAGKRDALDARLIISALAAEGRIQQVHSKGKSIMMGNSEAKTTIGALSKDLAARIKLATDSGKKGDAALKVALAAHGDTLPTAQSKGYTGRVMAIYKKMCGQG